MDGQGVQQFVGEDAVGRGSSGYAVDGQCVGNHPAGVGYALFPAGGGALVNDGVVDGVAKAVREVAGCGEDVPAEPAVAGAQFHNVERTGPVQQRPEVKKLYCEQRAIGRMHLGAGVIVGAGGGAGVVAARRVEGGAHELGEGDGAVAGDAATDGALGLGWGSVSRPRCSGGHSVDAGLPEQVTR